LRSCTGATLSLIVFLCICAVSGHRLILQLGESNQMFFRHHSEGFFEGMATSSELDYSDTQVAPMGMMTVD